jgi:hypothetical protein
MQVIHEDEVETEDPVFLELQDTVSAMADSPTDLQCSCTFRQVDGASS